MTPGYIEGTIRSYVDDASAGRPTPGGGSASALAGALGASMARMAANFTIGKKKFAGVEDEVRQILEGIRGTANDLLACVDDDVAAYASVSKAYSMPRATDDEKKARSAAIQDALVVAMGPPMRIVRSASAIARELGRLAEIANPMLVSDVGVAAALLKGALLGAKLNVDINLSSLKDAERKAQTAEELGRLVAEAGAELDRVYRSVEKKLGGK